ncbi:hypothetical protein F4778DRAFT_787618 [Xylariomycetidae sp. FL2044]|nr:hypothetical protein F4778DRAFT_787618 [Xylariomycetidae sp. FL2044]
MIFCGFLQIIFPAIHSLYIPPTDRPHLIFHYGVYKAWSIARPHHQLDPPPEPQPPIDLSGEDDEPEPGLKLEEGQQLTEENDPRHITADMENLVINPGALWSFPQAIVHVKVQQKDFAVFKSVIIKDSPYFEEVFEAEDTAHLPDHVEWCTFGNYLSFMKTIYMTHGVVNECAFFKPRDHRIVILVRLANLYHLCDLTGQNVIRRHVNRALSYYLRVLDLNWRGIRSKSTLSGLQAAFREWGETRYQGAQDEIVTKFC